MPLAFNIVGAGEEGWGSSARSFDNYQHHHKLSPYNLLCLYQHRSGRQYNDETSSVGRANGRSFLSAINGTRHAVKVFAGGTLDGADNWRSSRRAVCLVRRAVVLG